MKESDYAFNNIIACGDLLRAIRSFVVLSDCGNDIIDVVASLENALLLELYGDLRSYYGDKFVCITDRSGEI